MRQSCKLHWWSYIVRFIAFLRQSCNKSQGHCTVIARQSCGTSGRNTLVRALTIAVRTPGVSCSSLATALCALHKNRKKNEHVENLVFVVAAALRPTLWFAHNNVRQPHETQKVVVEEYGCLTIDVKQAWIKTKKVTDVYIVEIRKLWQKVVVEEYGCLTIDVKQAWIKTKKVTDVYIVEIRKLWVGEGDSHFFTQP